MDFRNKVETVLAPLVAELRNRLALLPTLSVLDNYQFRMNIARPDKSNVPDGFMSKWRYVWALLLSNSFLGLKDDLETKLVPIDELVEKIYDLYSIGAVHEPGHIRGSEKEFLTRLGLAIKVRELDVLGFSEQIQDWALARLCPFNNSYFLPTFGLRFEEILTWVNALISTTQTRLDAFVKDFTSIAADMRSLQADFASGHLDVDAVREKASQMGIEERLGRNGRRGENVHIFSVEELQSGIPSPALQALIKQFGIRPGEVGQGFRFPHDENPLEFKTFVVLPDDIFYFLNPANSSRVVAKTFEREILADNRLRDSYRHKRDRTTERWVTQRMKKVFSSAAIYPNYFLERGGHEKDLFVHDGDSAILIECKNSRVRPFKGGGDDLLKFEEDFKNSIQFGYEQALAVKRRILENEETAFFDEKGIPYFSVRRNGIKRFYIYIMCVTIAPRGPLGTDLSYQLKRPEGEPFPLALNLFDLDTICKHFTGAEQFVAYLQAREHLHGRVHTGDELNFAGYFHKYGNLNFEDHTQVADDFSGIFDRKWYKEKGIEVEEPSNPPVCTSITRGGNRVLFEDSTGRKEVIRVPPDLVERASGRPVIRMKGSNRNRPCPCGSGRKLKHCHGVS